MNFWGSEVRDQLIEKEKKIEKEKNDKAQKKIEKEQKLTKAKLEKIKKLTLALDKAQKDLNSVSINSEACSSKQSLSKEESCFLNKKSKCAKCLKLYGTARDQDSWIGCESKGCNTWICSKCYPLNFHPSDDFFCSKCEDKEN